MSMNDHGDQGDVPECPYCSSTSYCPHALLLVDKTFRTADGGPLMDSFDDIWGRLCEEGGDDFDEREAFDNLLEDVDGYANSSTDYEHEGGPGMSSFYSIYYVESVEKAQDVVARFMRNGLHEDAASLRDPQRT